MRKVKFNHTTWTTHEDGSVIPSYVQAHPGLFHQFGCDYEEFDTGAGNFSTAVIETSDGRLHNVPVEGVTFIEPTEIKDGS